MIDSIELFCGAGGLALGLQKAGINHKALFEWDKYSCARKIEVYTTKYERDSRVRRQFLATQIKPYKCEVCGMDFESVYGELGKDVIEVHHKKPLFINDKEQEIKPNGEYLACLCANCHRMIHRKQGSIMTIEELRKLMDKQRAGT